MAWGLLGSKPLSKPIWLIINGTLQFGPENDIESNACMVSAILVPIELIRIEIKMIIKGM